MPGLLAKSVAEAARFIVDRGVVAEGGPVLVRLMAQIHPVSALSSRRSLRYKPCRLSARSAVRR